ncbi:MAG: ComEA family DNA-binding protein [Myxococcota bacterium]
MKREQKGLLVALWALLLTIAGTRSWWQGQFPVGAVVEVRGAVPQPGYHVVEVPTVQNALFAAGVDVPPEDLRRVPEGHRVVWNGLVAQVASPSDPMLVGQRVNLAMADEATLATVPGIGERTAARIVTDRASNGGFSSIDDLDRVRGIGPATVERLRPFVQVEP